MVRSRKGLARATAKKGLGWIYLIFILTLINKPIYSEQAKNFRPRLSVRLSGAFGLTLIGDINKVMESINNNDTLVEYRKNKPQYIMGEIKKLNVWTPDWEAELRLDLTRRIGLGIATSGAFRRDGASSLTYTYQGFPIGLQVHTYAFKNEIKAEMPVRLNFYYSLNPGAKRNIFFNAGIGYYTGEMSQFFRLEVTPPGFPLDWVTRYWETERKSSLGFHMGAGMEFPLTEWLALVGEVQLRYARIGNFRAFVQQVDDKLGMQREETAFLFYYTQYDLNLGARVADIEVWQKPPEASVTWIADVRKATLDLGGFSLRVGMRLGLF